MMFPPMHVVQARVTEAMGPSQDGLEPVPVRHYVGDGLSSMSFNGQTFEHLYGESLGSMASRLVDGWRKANGAPTVGLPVVTVLLVNPYGVSSERYCLVGKDDRQMYWGPRFKDVPDAKVRAREILAELLGQRDAAGAKTSKKPVRAAGTRRKAPAP